MRSYVLSLGYFSFLINILGLTSSFFMLQVYDRVIPSHSIPTLIAMGVLAGLLYALYGFLDVIRARLLVRLGSLAEQALSADVFRTVSGLPLKLVTANDALRPVRELDQIRSFLSGAGLATLFDLPWLPVYLIICFLLHPFIGWLALISMLLLGALNAGAAMATQRLSKQLAEATVRRNRIGEAAHRNAELLASMGMSAETARLWEVASQEASATSRKISDLTGAYAGLSKIVRNVVQSAALGVGAYLVIEGQLSGGSIIAGSIVVARALAPVEQMIAQWRGMLQAYQSWKRLGKLTCEFPEDGDRTALPPPTRTLTVEGVSVGAPGRRTATISNVSFKVDAGSVVGIIGPSASGKTTLARAVAGVWPLLRGRIALDGAGLDQWTGTARGRHVGYMSQVSEFFPGSIAENIARLNEEASDDDVIAAARAAGAHDMIVALPDGYSTVLDEDGTLSAGQRQRLALARALFGEPFLVILDEPNSNLDGDGEIALSAAIASVKQRGGIVLVIAHRSSILSEVDHLLVIEQGMAKAFGPRDAILNSMRQQHQRAVAQRSGSPALSVVDKDVP